MPGKHDKQNGKDKGKSKSISKPDPETLHTTDPEEHMEGPVSSTMQKIKEGAEKNDQKDKKKD
ncbi:MAG TPA: hypothetical protein VFI06_08545 [Chitinophagaceae bacterium]|nr:hypothetical protein [Chitinophagaceae bacterium]